MISDIQKGLSGGNFNNIGFNSSDKGKKKANTSNKHNKNKYNKYKYNANGHNTNIYNAEMH